jgi:putative YjhG/YagF family dehydratase
MMMALAGSRDLPCVLIPGGVTLPASDGEDLGTVQTIGARFAHGLLSLEQAADLGCRACGSAGGGCQFLGTAATSQVVGEALGMSLPHSALTPSGQPIWLDMARRSARALTLLESRGIPLGTILTSASIRNAMAVHAAFGGSTNLVLHIPAIAYAAGIERPSLRDWIAVNRRVPRLVDALPNGPRNHPTVQVFLAGGVPEVMPHLRRLGLLDERSLTVTGETLGATLDWWEKSERRVRLRELLRRSDGVDPDDVIMSPERAVERGLTSTVMFPLGNLAPEGSVVKSTSIDPSVVDGDGVYRKTGPARVFTTEKAAIANQEPGKRLCPAGRYRGPDMPRSDRGRNGGDLSGHLCPQAYSVGQARCGVGGCTVFGHFHRRLHWPRRARGACQRPDRKGARRRHPSNHSRPETAGGNRRSCR